ncbi:tudor domain-containing protein [Haematococcus lacustris]|uniref:Tudor domain-containing protein n=1 Tax=Haematococcus lacustris TaxID=44745 RepID=A0A6A0ACV3_HAELA|nr:tudor domain-containing protein [Haematococcus lacustris]
MAVGPCPSPTWAVPSRREGNIFWAAASAPLTLIPLCCAEAVLKSDNTKDPPFGMPIHQPSKTKDNKAAGEVRSMKPLKHSDLNNRSSALKTPASQQKKISSFFTSTPKSAGNATPRGAVFRGSWTTSVVHAVAQSNGADGTPEPARQPSNNLCEQSTPNGAPVAAEATTPPPLAAAASVPAAAAPAPPPSIGAEVVGRRIKVFWPQEGTWFEGSISRYDQDKGKHRGALASAGMLHDALGSTSGVSYDDGDKEWVVLSAEQYELLANKARPILCTSLSHGQAGKLSEPGYSFGCPTRTGQPDRGGVHTPHQVKGLCQLQPWVPHQNWPGCSFGCPGSFAQPG